VLSKIVLRITDEGSFGAESRRCRSEEKAGLEWCGVENSEDQSF